MRANANFVIQCIFLKDVNYSSSFRWYTLSCDILKTFKSQKLKKTLVLYTFNISKLVFKISRQFLSNTGHTMLGK